MLSFDSKDNASRSARGFCQSALAVSCLLLAACGGGGGGSSTSTAPTQFSPQSVDEALTYAVRNGADGIWVYADKAGAPAVFKSAGFRSRATREDADLAALFKIASISKMYIATGSIKLVDDGLLSLDDTLADWLPDVAPRIRNAEVITLKNLLQHRSGVPDFDSQPGFSWQDAHTDVDRLLEFALDKPADFAPDTQREYSNTNYVLIGMILDTALGYSHHEFIRNEILTPFGLDDTFSLLADTDIERLARGYWDTVDRTEQDFVGPGGSMVSTAEEVGVFFRALATGDLLSATERDLFIDTFGGYRHSGWLPGYQSIARYDAAADLVLVQFINTTGGDSETLAGEVYSGLLTYLRAN